MIQLTEEYWKPLMGNEKGVKFEELVSDLLQEMYPKVPWIPTKKTHDGKKDFMVTLPVEGVNDFQKYWVECKNHSSTISINTLSPTLVIAVIERVRGIFFFSYSRVNDNAQNYLTQFASHVNKEISIWDDGLLEREILKHPKLLKKYFPLFKKTKIALGDNEHSIISSIKFRRDTAYSYKEDNQMTYDFSGEKILHVNESFCIDLLIRNVSANKKELRLQLIEDEFNSHFSLLDINLIRNKGVETIALNSGSVFFKRLVFRLEKYSTKISLPKIYISESEKLHEVLDAGYVLGNWIINAPLIGSKYIEFIDRIKNSSSYRNTIVTHCVYGESGSGKTRILKEAKDIFLYNGYRIYAEDGDFQSQQSTGLFVIRKIISEICGLPLKQFVTDTSIDVSLKLELDSIDKKILNLLYSDNYSLTTHLEEVIDIFIEYVGQKPSAILIDNIQFYDDDFALFLYNLLDTNKYVPISILLSFNTDYLYPQTKAFVLFERIKWFSKEKSNQVFSQRILGFSKGQAEEFIEHCIPGFSSLYPQTMTLMLQKIVLFPFYIEQTLHLLADQGAISKNSDFFYVSNIEKFHHCLNILPEKIIGILNLRWKYLIEKNIITSDNSLLKFVVLFQKLPIHLISFFKFSNDSILLLVQLGILDINTIGQIVFHHSQFLQFFDDKFFSKGIDKNIAKKSLAFIEKYSLEDIYPGQYFLIKNSLTPNDKNVLAFGASYILNDSIAPEYRSKFAKQLYNSLQTIQNLEGVSLLKVYTKICDDVKKYDEFSLSQKLFTQIYYERFENHYNYLLQGNDYFFFLFRYANSFLATHRDREAHEILLKGLSKIDEFKFDSNEVKIKAKASLLNRLCVTYKSLNYPVEADNAAAESLKLAESIGDKKIIIKNYIDRGYIYYKNTNSKDKLLINWGKAWDIFNNEYDDTLEDKRVSAYYHKALIELICNNWSNANYYAEIALNAASKELDLFNKIKVMLTQALIYFLSGKEEDETVENLIRESIDLCVKTNSMRSYWTSWHLLGKTNNNENICVNAYLAALEQLNTFIDSEKMEHLYLYFFDDLAMVMRWNRRNSQIEIDKILNQIRSRNIKTRVQNILKMSDEEFNIFLNSFKPITPITDSRSNFPCP